MSTHLGLRERVFEGSLNIFDSEKIRWVRGGVTLAESTVPAVDNKKVLKIGTPLGKITSGPDAGKYGPYDKDATDGRQTAVLMLGQDVDFSLGEGLGFGDQVATAFDWARVLADRLPVQLTGALVAQLRGITFVGDNVPAPDFGGGNGDGGDDGGDE